MILITFNPSNNVKLCADTDITFVSKKIMFSIFLVGSVLLLVSADTDSWFTKWMQRFQAHTGALVQPQVMDQSAEFDVAVAHVGPSARDVDTADHPAIPSITKAAASSDPSKDFHYQYADSSPEVKPPPKKHEKDTNVNYYYESTGSPTPIPSSTQLSYPPFYSIPPKKKEGKQGTFKGDLKGPKGPKGLKDSKADKKGKNGPKSPKGDKKGGKGPK